MDNAQFVSKKAYEICYALFRVAACVEREGFAQNLEKLGLDLMREATLGSCRRAAAVSAAIEQTLSIGFDAGILAPKTAEVIGGELKKLNAAIAELGNAAIAEEINLDGIFSSAPIIKEGARGYGTDAVGGDSGVGGGQVFNFDRQEEGSATGHLLENGNGSRSAAKAAMRQSMILERIRQNNNCRLKELQEVLPEVSERTLRYDVQGLMEKNLIERLGNGGPATYYRAL